MRRMAVGTRQQAFADRMMRGQVEARRDLGMTVDTESCPRARPGEARAGQALRRTQVAGLGVMRVVTAGAEETGLSMRRLGPVEMTSTAALVAVETHLVVGKAHGHRRSSPLDVERAGAMTIFALAVVDRRGLMAMTTTAGLGAETLGRALDRLRPLVSKRLGLGREPGTGRRPEPDPEQERTGDQPDEQQRGLSRRAAPAQRISASRALNDAPFCSMCPREIASS